MGVSYYIMHSDCILSYILLRNDTVYDKLSKYVAVLLYSKPFCICSHARTVIRLDRVSRIQANASILVGAVQACCIFI